MAWSKKVCESARGVHLLQSRTRARGGGARGARAAVIAARAPHGKGGCRAARWCMCETGRVMLVLLQGETTPRRARARRRGSRRCE